MGTKHYMPTFRPHTWQPPESLGGIDVICWLRPDAEVITLVGSEVSGWTSRGDFTETFVKGWHSRPTYNSSFSANGKTFPVVVFTAPGQWLTCSNSFSPTGHYTVFHVFYFETSPEPPGRDNELLGWRGSESGEYLNYFYPHFQNSIYTIMTKPSFEQYETARSPDNLDCFYGTYDGVDLISYTSADGYKGTKSWTFANFGVSYMSIGFNNVFQYVYSNVTIAEMLYFDGVLSAEQIASVKNYITNRYGIIFA